MKKECNFNLNKGGIFKNASIDKKVNLCDIPFYDESSDELSDSCHRNLYGLSEDLIPKDIVSQLLRKFPWKMSKSSEEDLRLMCSKESFRFLFDDGQIAINEKKGAYHIKTGIRVITSLEKSGTCLTYAKELKTYGALLENRKNLESELLLVNNKIDAFNKATENFNVGSYDKDHK